MVESVIWDNEITLKNIYNMDETGNLISTLQRVQVIVNSTSQMQYKAQPGRQEWVTAVKCICADGTAISPLFIFKGDNVSTGWIPKDVDAEWKFTSNSKGWTSNAIGLEWLQKVFDPATREKADGQPRLLICDGHNSHISGDFISYCIESNIILMLLPAHTSHLLQPLDVGLFSPLKSAISSSLDRLIRTKVSRIQKAEWLDIYQEA